MIEAMKSDSAFIAECKKIYAELTAQATKPLKDAKISTGPKKTNTMQAMADFTRTMMLALQSSDQKKMLKIRQIVDITINHVLIMSDPRIAERMVMQDFAKKYKEKLKN